MGLTSSVAPFGVIGLNERSFPPIDKVSGSTYSILVASEYNRCISFCTSDIVLAVPRSASNEPDVQIIVLALEPVVNSVVKSIDVVGSTCGLLDPASQEYSVIGTE